MLSVLAGGEIGPAGSAVGLYAASSEPVTVPPKLVGNGTTLLVFQAYGTESVSVALGSPGDDSLTLAMMTDATVTLTGGFLLLHEQTLTMTTMNATSADRRDKTTVSHRDVFTKASGAQTLTFSGGIYQTITLRKRPA